MLRTVFTLYNRVILIATGLAVLAVGISAIGYQDIFGGIRRPLAVALGGITLGYLNCAIDSFVNPSHAAEEVEALEPLLRTFVRKSK